MVLKVAQAASLRWPQPSLPQSPPSCSQTLASASPSPSSRRRSFSCGDLSLLRKKSGLFHGAATPLRRPRKSLTASLDSFSDEEFSKQIEELTLRFQLNDVVSVGTSSKTDEFEARFDNASAEEADFERQWQEGIVGAGGVSAYCSVKKAFSSMVFIIRELQSYTLQMRRSFLHYEDTKGIVAKVQREMHASFVWLFQKVFSTTPTLMVYVMILLANYSVFSMSTAIASPPPVYSASTTAEEVSASVAEDGKGQKFDASIVKTMKLSSLTGKAASVGGSSGGGGGKLPHVASGTEGDGRFDESNYYVTVAPDGSVSSFLNPSRSGGEESVSKEAIVWDSLVEEASEMGHVVLDQETKRGFVSPVEAKIEADDDSGYLRMELMYQTGLAQEPSNPLLLANYAQFLYLVVRDLDRYTTLRSRVWI